MNHLPSDTSKDWNFIKFVEESAKYMNGSTSALNFYFSLPMAWFKFNRSQKRDRHHVG